MQPWKGELFPTRQDGQESHRTTCSEAGLESGVS